MSNFRLRPSIDFKFVYTMCTKQALCLLYADTCASLLKNQNFSLICLKENADKDGFVRTNYFTSFANLLIWVEECSDNFKYVKLSAGNIFSQDTPDIPEAPKVPEA